MNEVSNKAWDELAFVNRFTQALPADPIEEVYPRQVEGVCYSRVRPTQVAKPELIAYSREVANFLDMGDELCESQEFAEVFAGNRILQGMDPYAVCYGGHQFGNWAGQLGDGRAINLGEVKNSKGEYFTLQLKGAGLTPYSRTADGLAVLRSSVREFLCSEAMHHLGVPTTRALSLCLTGEQVMRDMFYDGNAKFEPGAIVCRVAPSFTRLGNFEILAARGDYKLLREFVDFTIQSDFPELGEPSVEVYLQWFREVCQRAARMVVDWMRVGFVHGVMNTDNLSILGLTIDYGPYGWLEGYDPMWTPNTTDANGKRYRFGQQSEVAHWNLYQLARAIAPLFEEVEPLQEVLNEYPDYYQRLWNDMMAEKLGFCEYRRDSDDALFTSLDELLQLTETDMTLFYRGLANLSQEDSDDELLNKLQSAYYAPSQIDDSMKNKTLQWLRAYLERCSQEGDSKDEERRQRMNAVNPLYVLRNYTAQLAIDKAEQGDFCLVNEVLEVLRNPYEEQEGKESFAEKRPEWARNRPGCSMLSCSS